MVKKKDKTDREKVKALKILLQIQIEEPKLFSEDDCGGGLLQDEKKKETIVIDDS